MRKFMHARHLLAAGLLGSGLLFASALPLAAADPVMLINMQTSKCLTIAGGLSTENNVTALQFNCDDHPSRRWFINRVGSAFQIKNVQTGKCLTIAGGLSTANNVTALQFNCDSHPSRRWQVRASVMFDD
jgi:succinyl-CoA synthetase beta subunit